MAAMLERLSRGWRTALVAAALTVGSVAVAQEFRADHPDTYVVKRGDTLWDIAGRFLRKPWLWPEIWQANPQIRNPHLIYPGDVISLAYLDRVGMTPGPRDEAPINAIPLSDVEKYLKDLRVVDRFDQLPYVVGLEEDHLRVGQGQSGLYFASAELIPMLERRGLVRLFDHRVLELAMEMMDEDPDLVLSVNVSPRSLADPEWLDAFIACTDAGASKASRLIVEVTETATIENPARMAKLLGRIKRQGARIAIDDFGAGHTSLRHLRAFPIDILKIDGAFTQNLRRSTDDRFYVRTLVDLARHLGVETVAEWVDDEMQAAMLRDWGVTYLQGHLVGRAELQAPARSAPRKRAAG